MKLNLPKLFLYFLGALFLINLIQASFTELLLMRLIIGIMLKIWPGDTLTTLLWWRYWLN